MEWWFGVSVSVVRTGPDVGVRTHTSMWKQASMREVSTREQASLVSLKEALLPCSSPQSNKSKKYIHSKITEPEDTDKGPLLGHRAIF